MDEVAFSLPPLGLMQLLPPGSREIYTADLCR